MCVHLGAPFFLASPFPVEGHKEASWPLSPAPTPFVQGGRRGLLPRRGDGWNAQDRLFFLSSGRQDWRLPGPHLHEIQEGAGLLCRGAVQRSVSVTPSSSSTPHLPSVFLSVTSLSISIGPGPRRAGRHSSCVFAQGLMLPAQQIMLGR